MRRRRNPEIIAGAVNSAGTIAAGDGFSVNKTATGSYTVTITAPGFRMLTAVASQWNGSALIIDAIPQTGTNTIAVTIRTTAAALLDANFSFVAVGIQQ
jgi:hypothetical protein